MSQFRVKTSSILENHLPDYVREEYPLFIQFFKKYYESLENKGSSKDLIENIDQYVKLDTIANAVESTTLSSSIEAYDKQISVESVKGFPDYSGLIQIGDEIIFYESRDKNTNTFVNCVRGFSGRVEKSQGMENEVVFETTFAGAHTSGDTVKNLSVLFLKIFLSKAKKQYIPGFDNREFYSKLNQATFIKQARDFYSAKGTPESFRILFKALYGVEAEIIHPSEFIFEASNAFNRIDNVIAVELLYGDIYKLRNKTLYQDQYGNINQAFGTINDIVKISEDNRDYYILSLDNDVQKDVSLGQGGTFGSFTVHPTTQTLTETTINSAVVDVDSTLSFPNSGDAYIRFDDGIDIVFRYGSKTSTQFRDCEGISRSIPIGSTVRLDTFAYGFGDSEDDKVNVRVTGILSEFKYPEVTGMFKDDTVEISSLGYYEEDDFRTNEWIFNNSVRCKVKEIRNISGFSYEIFTFDQINILNGDTVELHCIIRTRDGRLENVHRLFDAVPGSDPKKSLKITNDSEIVTAYTVQRNIRKVPTLDYNADVTNTYVDNDRNTYVVSPSLPHYYNQDLSLKTRIVSFDANVSNAETISVFNHGFLTGDAVVYKPVSSTNSLNIVEGIYFVKKVNNNQLKLAKSRSDIFKDDYISLTGIATDNTLVPLKFVDRFLNTKTIQSQKSVRKFSNAELTENTYETRNGPVGMFVNGVEIFNYKSEDVVKYGSIENIIVASPGSGYDIINPPEVDISDEVGVGATAYLRVTGALDRIDIAFPGVDYVNEPFISVTGGNGNGAKLKASMVTYTHFVSFNSVAQSRRVDLVDDTISFRYNHEFRNGEKVIYKTQGGTAIGGLVNNAIYHVSVVGSKKIRLHNTLEDALVSTSKYDPETGYIPPSEEKWIDLTSFGSGNHIIESYVKRKKIGSIRVLDPGKNYSNRKTVFSEENVDVYSNTFNIRDHGYQTGDIIVYSATNLVGGLVNGRSYYVARLNADSFRLSEIATSPLNEKYYLENNYRVDLSAKGSGSFNYPDIKVKIDGTVGVSSYYFTGITTSATFNDSLPNSIGINTTGIEVGQTINQLNGFIPANTKVTSIGIGSIGINTSHIATGIQTTSVTFSEFIDFKARIIPVFRGEVHSVVVTDNGSGYGSEEIINYDRQPLITLKEGKDARAIPVISEGKIKEVLVQNTGSGYDSQPNIEILGDGVGANLTPIIENGRIVSIFVVTQGNGYNPNNTRIIITPSGVGFKGNARINQWTINNFQRFLRGDQISDDGGIIRAGRYGLQYTHIYPPSNLRDNVYGKVDDGVTIRYQSDLLNDTSSFKYHSPIIGWAYDGNPIYGPYGYDNPAIGGSVVQMKSGYELERLPNRPPNYPVGFFVEDYVFRNSGTLDQHNGRFCKTPEYPNGTYAYFTSFSENILDNGPFSGQKLPEFPYVIGNSYRSLPIEFNYQRTSTEDLFSFDGLIRNTYQYNLSSNTSTYPFIVNSSRIRKQTTDVKASSSGSVDSIEIISGGDGYKVGDTIIFNNSKTDGGFGAYAYVSQIGGKEVDKIYVEKTNILDVEVVPSKQTSNQYLLISNDPHGLNTFEDISITRVNTDSVSLKNSYQISVPQHQLQLKVGVNTISATGLTTYFEVSGKLSEPEIFVNDQYQIGNETVKILNIDPVNSRIKVLRGINGEDGSYSAGDFLLEKSRKFLINDEVADYNFNREEEYYFNPLLTVGFGTVGINSTIFLNTTNYGFPASVGVGTTTRIFFQNRESLLKFSGGGYVNLTNSTDSDFNVTKSKILSVSSDSITIDLDSSTLSGVGVTVFVDKWNIITPQLRSIYFPNHNFRTGQSVKYNSYVGTGLTVSNYKTDSFILENDQTLYIAKFDNNFIGISTNPIGIGTTGEFVGIGTTTGLLYFVGVGTESIHSFKTIESGSVKTDIEQKLVTVSTTKNPLLNIGDSITVTSTPSIKRSVPLIYDDASRRVLTNSKFFTPSAIDVENNIITLNNHGYYDGEKVILKTSSTGNGIENNQLFYVVVIDLNRIKLATLYKNRTNHIANITAQFPGTLYSVNPKFDLTRGQTLSFDLSDESLSYEYGANREPAFTFEIYTDRTFKTLFKSSQKTEVFEYSNYGTIGVTEDARVEIYASDYLPKYLYYRLKPSLNEDLPVEKKEIIIDDENNPTHSSIVKEESIYSGLKTVVGISTTSFSYTITKNPEKDSYLNVTEGSFKYATSSKLPNGPIEKVTIGARGKNYKRLPYIESINTVSGKDALIFPKSTSIGKILKTRINDPGYDYPSDRTLSPQAKLPQTIKLDPLASFISIEVVNQGVNYSTSPELVVKDGYTDDVVPDVSLEYEYGDNFVVIDRNTTGIYDVTPTFIPTNNSNGIPIKNISFDFDTKLVTVFLAVSYSSLSDFPFDVGDNVLIENISSIPNFGYTNKGYNSSGYNYALFEIISTDPNIGGSNASIVYSLEKYLSENQSPGNYNPSNSLGRIIPSKYFPQFNAVLAKNNLFIGETVEVKNRTFSGGIKITGVIEYWDLENQYMKISSQFRFRNGDIIQGNSSKAQAVIENAEQYNGYYDIQSSTLFERGLDKRTGFLNDSLQRLHDSDYYQYLSYAVKSSVSMNEWDDAVSTLTHPSGFKKFSDLSVDSRSLSAGMPSEQNFGDFTSKVDIDSVVSMNNVYDFDNVTESSVNIEGRNISEQIEFKSAVIQDYAKSIGNKVLLIDDISPEFNSDPRIARFSIVNTFRLNEFRSRKYIITIKDKRYTGEKEVLLATLLHDDKEAYLNQYGSVSTIYDMGSFDTQIFGEQGRLLFYPNKYEFNDFDTSFISFDLTDVIQNDELQIGNCISIKENGQVGIGTTTIFEMNTNYGASKILLQYKTSEGYEFDEVSLVHDGTNVELLEYGQLTNSPALTSYSGPGFGTYHPYIDGSLVKIDFYPYNNSLEYECNLLSIDLTSNSSGVGSTELNTGLIRSFHTNIPSSGSPSDNVVAEYSNIHNGCYIFAFVEDVTNSKSQISEIVTTSESTNSDITEFGIISTGSDYLGTFAVDSDGSNTSIKFTPLPNVETNVVIFQSALKNPTTFYSITNIDI